MAAPTLAPAARRPPALPIAPLVAVLVLVLRLTMQMGMAAPAAEPGQRLPARCLEAARQAAQLLAAPAGELVDEAALAIVQDLDRCARAARDASQDALAVDLFMQQATLLSRSRLTSFNGRHLAAVLPALHAVLELQPGHSLARSSVAGVLAGMQRFDEAREALAPDCADLEQDRPLCGGDLYLMLPWAQLLCALRREDCASAYRQLIQFRPDFDRVQASDPNLRRAYVIQLASLARKSGDPDLSDAAWQHAAELRNEPGSGRMEQWMLETELFNELLRQKFAQHKTQVRQVLEYDRNSYRYAFSQVQPVFIVGHPRSGSTLVHQMLGQHSRIVGLGEFPNPFADVLNGACTKQSGGNWTCNLRGTAFDDLLACTPEGLKWRTSLAYSYRRVAMEQLELYFGGPLRNFALPRYVIDKTLSNWLHIPQIKIMFPQAKVILVERDLLDTAASQFVTVYPTPGGLQKFSLAHIASMFELFSKTMATWRDLLGDDQWLTLRYEQLVQNPEQELGRIMSYLELEPQETCLDFHRSGDKVWTSSSEQVSRPLYRTSIGHGALYRDRICAEPRLAATIC